MTARVIKRMSLTKASIVVFVVVALLTTLFMLKIGQGEAAPNPATVGSTVPHYFGPNPNWALSPLTLPDATVTITTTGSYDTAATAVATVGAKGAITDITITDPGSGYASADVSISGAGTQAAASAVVSTTSAVTAVNVTAAGAAYKKPVVSFSGGGGAPQATATAYGGVDAIAITAPGSGYTFPTVDFDWPDDINGTQAKAHAEFDAVTGAITAVVVDDPGSGYSSAPGVVIRDGTIMDPINNGGAGATATATIKILRVGLDTFGAGYTSAPTVTIGDATGAGHSATAAAVVDAGAVTAINLTNAGTGYITGGGIQKFQDDLPGLCDPAGIAGPVCPGTGKYIPLGVPEEKAYLDPNGKPIKADEYEIGLVQYRTTFSSDLPATLARGYVQLETPSWLIAHPGVSLHYPLTNANADPTKADTPILINGTQAYAVTPPQWLGVTIAATKNKPVRVVFHNLLPTGSEGDLFLPTDTTLMGSGAGPIDMPAPFNDGTVTDEVRNPVCTENPQDMSCFKQNRATLHLHGGITPWISDGTPHQWITPANEDTPWPQGVSVQNVPDMDVGTDARDGIQTFYYTNQQSARLMWYHDHAYGITRLNVYVGEAAGYLIADDTEKTLIASGTIPGPADTIPLIVQDRTFVPQDAQLYDSVDATGSVVYGEDPTWDKTRWSSYGGLWYHHVYMPAQNPGDPSGANVFGRWMYGPWFWPPAADTVYGPITNPFFDPNCNLDDPATWQYQTYPFCEPQQMPGTPNISVGMEQFNDTPLVNGVAYPKLTLEPKTYRLRVLNGANDRFFNFQWYVADPRTGTLSEVALKQSELNAAQTDPIVFPTPDTAISAPGPDWIQIGSEGGFLPAPTVVDGHQPITWITDPTRFDYGNVDLHSLVLGPAERADVIVDFSQYAGQTLILYNDAPAAYPARMPYYDYYTGGPDLRAIGGAPKILPGYGPNSRTIMQVTISGTPAPAFNLTALRTAFSHKADGSGVFESGQNPIIVGQAAYNSAYGTSFAASSNCNAAGSTLQICDGLVRINDIMTTFGFNTLNKPTTRTTIPLQPKALHDEMNATTFDEYGRMQATLGVEALPPTPGVQTVVLYPFINPSTELLDGTNLPQEMVAYDADGNPVSDLKIAPMSNPDDGTQLWSIVHNGVDTHPIHFHLFDVQIVNRVTWDNIIIPTEPSELGWKDTVRASPLENTIVALRPVLMDLPWELPNAIHNLNPAMPTGSTAGFNNIDPQGNPTLPVINQLVNFGWEYVYHCHILSHEEMDMMRPVTMAVPPIKPDGLAYSIETIAGVNHVKLTWNDNSISETAFVVQQTTDGTTWTDVGTIVSPLDQPNIHEPRSFTDPAAYSPVVAYRYRVVAQNTVGYGAEFPTMTVQSLSNTVDIGAYTITPTAGANGSIAPGTPLAVPMNGNATFTITPASTSYYVRDVLVDGFSVGAVGTYRFVNVIANHTISALFEAKPVLAVTSPNGGESWLRNSTHDVTWTAQPSVSGGSFRLQLYDTTGAQVSQWVSPLIPAVAAQTSYAYGWAVTQAVGTTWRMRVFYYDTAGNQVAVDTSNASFAITEGTALAVTSPNGGENWLRSSTHNVTWTANPEVSSGSFRLLLYDTTGAQVSQWVSPLIPAVAAQTSYTHAWAITQAAGANWRMRVYYYNAAGTQLALANSNASFTITENTVLAVTSPNGGESWPRLSTHNVIWTVIPAVSSGSFRLQLNDSTGIQVSQWVSPPIPAVAARTIYTYSWTITLAVGATWRMRVYCYDAAGAQLAAADSSANFRITP